MSTDMLFCYSNAPIALKLRTIFGSRNSRMDQVKLVEDNP